MSARAEGRLSFDALIQRARGVPIERVLEQHGIATRRESKYELVGPCPRCGTGDDRFSVNVAKQVWNCRRCKTKEFSGDAIGLVRWLEGIDFIDALSTLAKMSTAEMPTAEPPRIGKRERHRRGDDWLWRRVWTSACDPRETPVDHYLARRHLGLPPDAGDCLRFHRRCRFGKDDGGRTIYTPAMVALVRNIVTNEPQGIHRTALDLSGHKVFIGGRHRRALGAIAGGAVKLTADENVTMGIGIGEGIETTLSLRRMPEWAGSPVWSLINDSGVAKFPVLAGIETLVAAVDHDEAGGEAVLAVAERWRAKAREVLLFEAVTPEDDLNDVICDE